MPFSSDRSQSIGRGLLAVRPLANATAPGSLFLATDVAGGTQYQSNGTTWAESALALSGAGAGQDLASAAPVAALAGVVVNVAATPIRVPELTTGSFVMPTRPVYVMTSAFLSSGVDAATPVSEFQVRYQKNGAGAWILAENRAGAIPAASPFWESTYQFLCPVPYPGATGADNVAAGDSVQVALFIARSDTTKTITILRSAGVYPLLRVVGG